MVIYVPGTEETDPKKQNMSLQQIAGAATTAIANVATNTTNIATNTTNIATNTANIATNTTNIAANTSSISTINSTLSALAGSPITNALGADVVLNNIANYFTGPTVAQGSTGTWFASGVVTVTDTGGNARINCKLWDGTTVIASGQGFIPSASGTAVVSLSGVIVSPAGNIRISCNDMTLTTGKILFNATGASKDATLTAYRIA